MNIINNATRVVHIAKFVSDICLMFCFKQCEQKGKEISESMN